MEEHHHLMHKYACYIYADYHVPFGWDIQQLPDTLWAINDRALGILEAGSLEIKKLFSQIYAKPIDFHAPIRSTIDGTTTNPFVSNYPSFLALAIGSEKYSPLWLAAIALDIYYPDFPKNVTMPSCLS